MMEPLTDEELESFLVYDYFYEDGSIAWSCWCGMSAAFGADIPPGIGVTKELARKDFYENAHRKMLGLL